jgi:O-antigen ligase
MNRELRIVYLMAILFALPYINTFNHPPVPSVYTECLAMLVAAVAIYFAKPTISFKYNINCLTFSISKRSLVLISSGSWLVIILAQLNSDVKIDFVYFLLYTFVVILMALLLAANWKPDPIFTFENVASAIAIAGLIASVPAWVQFFSIEALYDIVHQSRDPGRAFGHLRQPNHFALIMCMAGYAAANLLFSLEARFRKTGWICLAFIVPAIIFSGSRMGILLCVILTFHMWIQRREQRLKIIFISGFCLVSCWLLIYLGSELAGLPFFGLERHIASSSATGERNLLWGQIFQITKQLPLLGCGVGQFTFCFAHASFSNRIPGNITNAHNILINALVEYGVVVAFLFLLIFIYVLLKCFRRFDTDKQKYAGGALLCFLIHCLLEYPYIYMHLLIPAMLCMSVILEQKRIGQVDDVSVPDVPNTKSRSYLSVWLTIGALLYSYSYHALRPMFDPRMQNIANSPVVILHAARYGILFRQDLEFSFAWRLLMTTAPGKLSSANYQLALQPLRSSVSAGYMARLAVEAAAQKDLGLAKHLSWRAYSQSHDMLQEMRRYATAVEPRVSEEYIEYLNNPHPFSIGISDLRQKINLISL